MIDNVDLISNTSAASHVNAPAYPQQTLLDVKNPSFISFLDLARWMAATIVCIGHLRNPLFFGYGSLTDQDSNILVILWYFVSGWFGEAVIMFFVLSGYLVGGIGLAKHKVGSLNLKSYGIDRGTRLYLAFLPALLLTVMLDYFGTHYFGGAELYSHGQAMIAEKINTAPFETMANVPNFWGNVMMLQYFHFDSYGTNQPLWTISAEFWFYGVFGLGVLFFTKSGWARAAVAAALVGMFLGLGLSFLTLLGLWLIGMAVAAAEYKKLQKPILSLCIFAGLLVGLRLFSDQLMSLPFGLSIRNYLVAITFAYVLFSMRGVKSIVLIKMAAFNKFMASFSFSLYLIHFPMMIFLYSALYAYGGFDGIKTGYSPVDIEGLSIYAGVILCIYAASYLFSRATEEQTWRVRKYLKAKLLQPAS